MNNRILAAWMVAVMTGVCFLPLFCGVQAEQETVAIATPEEWITFLKACNSDGYSRGRNFVLTNDIDLGGVELSAAAIFCGTLSGNGHSVKGIQIQAADENSGIFHRITSEGIIRDLCFEGKTVVKDQEDAAMSVDSIVGGLMKNAGISGISPIETTGCIGGVSGINEGQIINVSYVGEVDGKRCTGGIVGENKETGMIDMCRNTAEITGLEMTGGIAGKNSGRIKNCENAGTVCKTANETDRDIGGIAGFSEGVIELCTNTGTIGCKGFGINTGGIVGRQSGCVLDSVNKGEVLGQRNTGGIVGMFIPYTDIDISVDTLRQDVQQTKENMKEEVQQTKNAIQNETDKLLSDIAGIAKIGDQLGISNILPSLLQVGESLIGGSSRQEILDALQNTIASFGTSAQEIADGITGMTDGLSDETKDALSTLNTLLEVILQDAENLSADLQDLETHLADWSDSDLENKLENWEDTVAEDLEKAEQQTEELLDGLEAVLLDMERAAENLNSTAIAIRRAVQGLREDLGDVADVICAPLEALEEIVQDTREKYQTYYENLVELEEKIKEKLDDIRKKLEQKKEVGNLWGKIFSSTVVYAQELAVTDILDTEQIKEELKKVVSVDVSLDRQVAGSYADNALIRYCIHSGDVTGGSNVGGIVGNMGVESLQRSGDVLTFPDGKAVTSGMFVKAHVNACISDGCVVAKSDHSGGIVGYATVGTVKNCLGAGEIEVTEGGYAGGIGGEIYAAVENCIAVTTLKGMADVGGIAGKSGKITGCYALPTIKEEVERSGGIAGSADETLTDNYFIDEGLGGVGGSSYERSAQALPFSDMTGQGELPPGMQGFSEDVWMMDAYAVCFPQLRFLAENDSAIGDLMKAYSSYYASTDFRVYFVSEDTLVQEQIAAYGQVLPKEDIPVLEKRDGFYPFWDGDVSAPILRHTTFRAIYDKAVTTIASDETPPILLLEGNFSEESSVEVERTEISQPCASGYEKGAAYTFVITPADDANGGFTMRVLDESRAGEAIAVLKDGELQTLSCSRDGRYLVCDMEEVLPFVILNKKDMCWWIVGAVAAGILFICSGFYCWFVRKRKSQL